MRATVSGSSACGIGSRSQRDPDLALIRLADRLHLFALVAALSLGEGAVHLAQAQDGVTIDIVVAPATQQRSTGPLVSARGVLGDKDLLERLQNGFPTRLHFRVELWGTAKFFNDQEGQREWDLVIRYDALDKVYAVVRAQDERVSVLGRFDKLSDAQEAAESPTRVSLVPRRDDRYYYIVRLGVETLSLSDLNEVESWLKGDFNPAVRGDKPAGTAIGRGLKALFLKLLGGDKRQYERRSTTFSPP